MLVTFNEIIALANEKKCAVGAFNTPTLETVTAVIRAAEKLDTPVMITHAQLHEPIAPIDIIGPVMLLAAKAAKVPVCVHLDHCESIDYMKRALDMGFTGVMYDGSTLPYAENLANTITATKLAHSYGVGIEAEIGSLASREDGSANAAGPVYTDPDEALKFCSVTGIDVLAPSFGTAHGIYKSKPVLDLERVRVIAQKTGMPLAMHGGSGVSPEDYRTGISYGIRKINYFSYMSKAGTSAAVNLVYKDDVTFYYDIANAAQTAMQADAEKAMRIFMGL